MLIIRGEKEGDSFGLEGSISLKSKEVFDLVDIDKHLKLDKKLIRFTILMGLLSILMPPTPNQYFF